MRDHAVHNDESLNHVRRDAEKFFYPDLLHQRLWFLDWTSIWDFSLSMRSLPSDDTVTAVIVHKSWRSLLVPSTVRKMWGGRVLDVRRRIGILLCFEGTKTKTHVDAPVRTQEAVYTQKNSPPIWSTTGTHRDSRSHMLTASSLWLRGRLLAILPQPHAWKEHWQPPRSQPLNRTPVLSRLQRCSKTYLGQTPDALRRISQTHGWRPTRFSGRVHASKNSSPVISPNSHAHAHVKYRHTPVGGVDASTLTRLYW